jgi:hypothetical protein
MVVDRDRAFGDQIVTDEGAKLAITDVIVHRP